VWAAVCGRTLSRRSITLDVSIPHLLFWMADPMQYFQYFACNTLLTLLWSLVAWIPHIALLSCPRKQLLSDSWQADNICLNFFGLFGKCVCVSSALTALWFQYSKMKPRFHHPLLICCDWELHCHLCGITLKCQSWSHSLRFVHNHEYLFTHLWTFYTTVLQFLHSLHFGRKLPHITHDGFLRLSCFSMKKADNIGNFAAGRIINCRTHHNSLCRDKNKYRWPVMWRFTRQWVIWCYLACTSSLPLLHYLPKINRDYFLNNPHNLYLRYTL
jgi:hypothetical protein